MNKRSARRNLWLSLALLGGSIFLTLLALGYIQFFRGLLGQG